MKIVLEFTPNIESLFGTRDENLRLMEDSLGVRIDLRSDNILVEGPEKSVPRIQRIFQDFESLRSQGVHLHMADLNGMLRMVVSDPSVTLRSLVESAKPRSTGTRRIVQPRSVNQRKYVEAIEQNDMVFGIGPAGTGKTYLAVAMAASTLMAKKVSRIVLVPPAIEAGERLSFLAGSLQEKVDPYLRPLYDALYDLLEPERVDLMLEKNLIEVAPLDFMRGRTLNDAFIIMDDAQNTTVGEMTLFLTRLGHNSKAVITGDITQINLPSRQRSGLVDAIDSLKDIGGIAFCHFEKADVVRHALVQRIVRSTGADQQKIGPPLPLSKVFISCTDDTQHLATELSDALHQKGVHVWVAFKKLSPGQNWKAEVELAIEDAQLFLVLVGPKIKSFPWLEVEWRALLEETWTNNKKILPVIVGPTTPPPFLRNWVPLRIDPATEPETWLGKVVDALMKTEPQDPDILSAQSKQEREKRLKENLNIVDAIKRLDSEDARTDTIQ